ncbi:MAG: tetraacyldisaccharide 4'-kinase [Phycisphaerales bacterium]
MKPAGSDRRDGPPQDPRGPLSARLGALGTVLGRAAEPLYRMGINRVNRRYDAGAGVVRLDVPVVSIGNLSVGGTGKTPMVAWVARELVGLGMKPCVAMRGYARSGAHGRSDEEDEYGRLLPGVPIVAQPDRSAGIARLLRGSSGSRPDVVVLDDGFQHRRLARGLDVVLIDISRDPFQDRLLPAGWLREPVESLRRADAVVLTHAELAPDEVGDRIEGEVRRVMAGATGRDRGNGGASPLIARARHVWRAVNVGDESRGVEWLRGVRALVVCAVGNPGGFIAGARRHGVIVAGEVVLPDHDPYAPRTLDRIARALGASGAEVILTSEKDWSKLRDRDGDWARGRAVARPSLGIEFDRGRTEFLLGLRRAVGLA